MMSVAVIDTAQKKNGAFFYRDEKVQKITFVLRRFVRLAVHIGCEKNWEERKSLSRIYAELV